MIPFSFQNNKYNYHSTPYVPNDIPYNYHQFNQYYKKFEKKDFDNNINTKKEQESNSCSSDNLFDFFGIKLASDDLIIIALLFFLYNEKVNDTYLFIALIMLLLS